MQAILGTAIFIIVCIVALGVSFARTASASGPLKLVLFPSYFAGTIIACYVGLAIIGGLLWVIAWIGILIREGLQWLVGMVLYPWHWII